jgi:hypothetical protein
MTALSFEDLTAREEFRPGRESIRGEGVSRERARK